MTRAFCFGLATMLGQNVALIANKFLVVRIQQQHDAALPQDRLDNVGHIHGSPELSYPVGNVDRFDSARLDPDAISLQVAASFRELWPAPRQTQKNDLVDACWIPTEGLRRQCPHPDGGARDEWMWAVATELCRLTNYWLADEIYGYDVKLYAALWDAEGKILDDVDAYDKQSPLYEDTCWDSYGRDQVEEAVRDRIVQALSLHIEPQDSLELLNLLGPAAGRELVEKILHAQLRARGGSPDPDDKVREVR